MKHNKSNLQTFKVIAISKFKKMYPFITGESAEIHGVNIRIFIFYRHFTKVRGTLSLM
jgi:hypothetical protein